MSRLRDYLALVVVIKFVTSFVTHGSTFVRALSLGSLQFGGYIKSADLPILSPNLAPPKPPTRKDANGKSVQACVTLSAGILRFNRVAIGLLKLVFNRFAAFCSRLHA